MILYAIDIFNACSLLELLKRQITLAIILFHRLVLKIPLYKNI